MFINHLLCVWHCTNHFTFVASLNPQDNLSVKFYPYPHFRVEEIEAKFLAQSQVS